MLTGVRSVRAPSSARRCSISSSSEISSFFSSSLKFSVRQIRLISIHCYLLQTILSLLFILFKNEAWRERVAVLAVGAALWTRPEPPVLVVLHRVEKELANLDTKKIISFSCESV